VIKQEKSLTKKDFVYSRPDAKLSFSSIQKKSSKSRRITGIAFILSGMIPIDQLLNRIRWDREFGDADFVIGYYDRVTDEIIQIPFSSLITEAGDHFSMQILNDDTIVRSVPLHRVREVYRNGKLIWRRSGLPHA